VKHFKILIWMSSSGNTQGSFLHTARVRHRFSFRWKFKNKMAKRHLLQKYQGSIEEVCIPSYILYFYVRLEVFYVIRATLTVFITSQMELGWILIIWYHFYFFGLGRKPISIFQAPTACINSLLCSVIEEFKCKESERSKIDSIFCFFAALNTRSQIPWLFWTQRKYFFSGIL